MARFGLIAVAAIAGLAATQALAAPMDTTGTGGGPATAAKAPYTTSTGATVPRPGSVDRMETGSIDRRTNEDRVNDKVISGICIGCAPK